MPLFLHPHETLHDGLGRLARERLDEVVARLDPASAPVSEADRGVAVHESRKRLKELRALVRLVGPAWGADRARALDRQARDLGRALADARDAAVLQRVLGTLGVDAHELVPAGGTTVATWSPGNLAALHAAAQRTRARLDDWPLPEGGWGLVRDGLRQTWRDGRHRLRRAREQGDAESLHALRGRAKARLFQVRVFAPAWPAVLGPLEHELHALGEALGDHHDLAVALHRLGPALPDEVRAEALARMAGYEARAFALADRLYGGTARGWERMMRDAWRAWRREECTR